MQIVFDTPESSAINSALLDNGVADTTVVYDHCYTEVPVISLPIVSPASKRKLQSLTNTSKKRRREYNRLSNDLLEMNVKTLDILKNLDSNMARIANSLDKIADILIMKCK